MSKAKGYKARLVKISYKLNGIEAYELRTTATSAMNLVKSLILKGADYIRETFPEEKPTLEPLKEATAAAEELPVIPAAPAAAPELPTIE